MRTIAKILCGTVVFFCACKNHKAADTKVMILPADEDGHSLISDKIHQTIVSINDFEETQDAYRVASMQRKQKDIQDETRDACDYLDKWKERLIDDAGGLSAEGELKGGNDTKLTTKLLVQHGSADTLRWHMEEVREVFLRDVKDTAGIVNGLPESISTSNSGKQWNIRMFDKVPVFVALTTIEKMKADVYAGELLALNKMLLEAKDHPQRKPVARP